MAKTIGFLVVAIASGILSLVLWCICLMDVVLHGLSVRSNGTGYTINYTFTVNHWTGLLFFLSGGCVALFIVTMLLVLAIHRQVVLDK